MKKTTLFWALLALSVILAGCGTTTSNTTTDVVPNEEIITDNTTKAEVASSVYKDEILSFKQELESRKNMKNVELFNQNSIEWVVGFYNAKFDETENSYTFFIKWQVRCPDKGLEESDIYAESRISYTDLNGWFIIDRLGMSRITDEIPHFKLVISADLFDQAKNWEIIRNGFEMYCWYRTAVIFSVTEDKNWGLNFDWVNP